VTKVFSPPISNAVGILLSLCQVTSRLASLIKRVCKCFMFFFLLFP
jgi:hypothetical protein